jgi:hypothetical protein
LPNSASGLFFLSFFFPVIQSGSRGQIWQKKVEEVKLTFFRFLFVTHLMESVKKEESESDDSKPLVTRAAAKPQPTKTTRASKRAAPKAPAKGKQPKRKKNANNDDEDGDGDAQGPDGETQQDEAMYRWWEENENDDSKKWSTLEVSLCTPFPPERLIQQTFAVYSPPPPFCYIA